MLALHMIGALKGSVIAGNIVECIAGMAGTVSAICCYEKYSNLRPNAEYVGFTVARERD